MRAFCRRLIASLTAGRLERAALLANDAVMIKALQDILSNQSRQDIQIMALDDNFTSAFDKLTAAFNAERAQRAQDIQEAVAKVQAAQNAADQAEFDKAAARMLAIAQQLAQSSEFTPSGNVPTGG